MTINVDLGSCGSHDPLYMFTDEKYTYLVNQALYNRFLDMDSKFLRVQNADLVINRRGEVVKSRHVIFAYSDNVDEADVDG